jgi:hypothetical protein
LWFLPNLVAFVLLRPYRFVCSLPIGR